MPLYRRQNLPHDVPLWIDPTQEAFFITINCLPRGVNQLAFPEKWQLLLEGVGFYESRGDWQWRLILAMPDHLHGIVSFPVRYFPKKIISSWKRWIAKQAGINWQDGYFDHRLRNWESATEKGNYIRLNPLRAGLINEGDHWPYLRDWRE